MNKYDVMVKNGLAKKVYIVCVNSSIKHDEIIFESIIIPIEKQNDFNYIAYLWSLQYGLYTKILNNTFTTQYESNGKFIIVDDIDNYNMNDLEN